MEYFKAMSNPSKFVSDLLCYSPVMGHFKRHDFVCDRNKAVGFVVIFVLSGKMHIEQRGHRVVTANQGVILRIDEKHKYYTDKKDVCEIIFMDFNGKACNQFMNFIDQMSGLPYIFECETVKHLIEASFKAVKAGGEDREISVSQNIYSILTTLANLCKSNKNSIENTDIEFRNKVNLYIEKILNLPVSLDEIAKEFNISKYHFCRKFKLIFGETPVKYIKNKKLDEAKFILNYTNMQIVEISTMLGFSDQSHFTKSFYSYTKTTPRAFRKMLVHD